MTPIIKTFDQLTTRELYGILQLRAEVFIVEQGGRYQDLDGIDCRSTHIFCRDAQGTVTGCIRVFPKEDEPGTAQFGRLVAKERLTGMGRCLMDWAARVAKERYGAQRLYLTGRKSAQGFYRKCGFHEAGPELAAGDVGYFEFRRDV